MSAPNQRQSKRSEAVLETARLISLLETSQRLLDDGALADEASTSLRMARDEAINSLLKLNARIAELQATQESVLAATQQLADELDANRN